MMVKMVLLVLAGQKYSLSVEQIRHILPRPNLFSLVCLRRGVSGVFLYGDEPVPLLDTMELAGIEALDVAVEGEYVIVFQSEYGNVGIPVDSAVKIVDVEDGLIEDTDHVGDVDQSGQVFCFQGVSYPILDIESMLARMPY